MKAKRVTVFGLLLKLSGLTQAESAAFLNVSKDSVDAWSRGKRTAGPGVIAEMRALIARQQEAADEFLDMLDEAQPKEVELGFPADDHEAQQLGLPSVNAWGAMAARVIAETKTRVVLVPRGTTAATAAAIRAKGV